MHIMIIPSWYPNSYHPLSGIFFKEQAEALAKYGLQVGLIAVQEISIKEMVKQKKIDIQQEYFTEKGVRTYLTQYPALPKMKYFRGHIKKKIFARLFERYIEENGLPDIIHLHSFIAGELALYVKEKYAIPYVVTEHSSGFSKNIFSPETLHKAANIFRQSNANIAVSPSFAFLLSGQFRLHFESIPNIVNTDYFISKTTNTTPGFKFINIAFLNKNKNQAMLIKAFASAFKGQSGIELTIVGNGPEYFSLKSLIQSLKLENQVSLYGKADRAEVRQLLQKSDAFILSSQYETFGVVIIEALATGLPVLATRCGGAEDILTDSQVGILTDISAHSLSQGLLELYAKRNSYDSAYIRSFAVQHFSEHSVIQKLQKIYLSILAGSNVAQ